MNIKQYDEKELYCRMLGHHLHFSYCRAMQDGKPCKKIRDCWYSKFDIHSYLSTHFDLNTITNLNKKSQDKVTTIFDIMRQAQERAANSKKTNDIPPSSCYNLDEGNKNENHK